MSVVTGTEVLYEALSIFISSFKLQEICNNLDNYCPASAINGEIDDFSIIGK